MGSYLLIGQGLIEDTDTYLVTQLRRVEEIILFHIGNDFKSVSDEAFVLASIMDLVDGYLRRMQDELPSLIPGISWVVIDDITRDQLDRSLAGLEENEAIYGSALVLNSSLLHSRLPAFEARMAVEHLRQRPLGPAKIRAIPVYCLGVWKHMLCVRLRTAVLVTLTTVGTPIGEILPSLEAFEEALVDAALQLPLEEPPVLLRHFTGHDTLGLIYRHSSSALVVPAWRPAPSHEHTKLYNIFSWFYNRACDSVAQLGDNECEWIMFREGYRFHVRIDQQRQLYVLYSDQVKIQSIENFTNEILSNIERYLASLLSNPDFR